MTTREQTLAKIAVPVMGLAVLYLLTHNVLITPFVEVADRLQYLEDKKEDTEQKIKFARKRLQRYHQLCSFIPVGDAGSETVAKNDEDSTKEYLRKKIDQILASANFEEKNVTPPSVTRGSGRGRKKKLATITYSLAVRGDLKDVLQFMLDTYRMEDPIYISSIKLKPDKRLFSESIDATIKIQTAVVPRDESILERPYKSDRAGTGEGDGRAGGESSVGRLAEASLAAYRDLLDWRPFDAVRPDPLEVARGGGGARRDGDGDDPRPSSDPTRDNMIVRGFLNDSVLVVQKNTSPRRGRTSRRSGSDERFYFTVGEEIDGGTLEFVHRLGVVVSKMGTEAEENGTGEESEDGEEGGNGDSSELWVYQYGQSFSKSKLLDDLIKEFGEFRQLRWAMEAAKPVEQPPDEPLSDGTESKTGGEQESSDEANESKSGN